MNRFKTLIASLVIVGCAVAPSVASAQSRWGGDRREDRNWERGFRTGEIRGLVDRLERQSNNFRSNFERNYGRFTDRSNGWHGRGDRRSYVEIQRLDEAFERLRRKVDSGDWRSGRGDVETIVRNARGVDRIFSDDPRARRFGEGDWGDLRRGINDLARMYNVRW